MEYVRLGRSGLKVAQVCLGTLTFGREADEETAFRILDRYVDLGGNFIDTADGYSAGASETIVGRWLKRRALRDSIVLASKVYWEMGPGPNDRGLSRLHILRAVEDSLKRLQSDVIDLYQIHQWDPDVPIEETMETLNDLLRQGKVRYVGSSNLTAWQLSAFLRASERHGWSCFVSNQPAYSAINRSIENEILPLCHQKGLGVITFNPLAGGMLTGKYARGAPLPQGTRFEQHEVYCRRYYTDQTFDIVEQFMAAARQRGVTPAQLALAWVIAEPRVTCPIVGARNPEQLSDSLGAVHIRLSPEERAQLPAVLPGRWVGSDPVYDGAL
jgi:aryl-alcohol dehydrogenase-like predicted oxidoreductase